MLVSDFNFDLPEDLIAQSPPAIRGTSRMLSVDRATGTLKDDTFANLPSYLREGDLLILNDSRVIPARLFATRARSPQTQASSPDPTGRIEVLLTQQLPSEEQENIWSALVRPSRKIQPGEHLHFADPVTNEIALTAEVLTTGEFGERILRFVPNSEPFHAILDRIGHMPLPPYIHRDDAAEDRQRYQTVYANQPGSAAAPTAGLHFTPEVLQALKTKGVQIEYVTLHVGLGTFQPVRATHLADIRLHAEHYTLPAATATAINEALADRRRIIAAGTTTTRTLEHCALVADRKPLEPHSSETSIFISPGHTFRIVQGLLTNFHLPQSTLLMLVSALAAQAPSAEQGRELILSAYHHAVQQRYRFFSYGDCMLLV
ncbi:S-adenosylmethionine:tRNA ribosyltransferase-isomerase [Granulicella aggregans]|uniref:S-adenosylmethionine:tRNA ribosyltransferase-isomerase n=1 Tax=Granulicella aggregans TaxID=474949 RepID=A0A7W7ZC96_9BACT|nr:S-adenosylmethionine:tRNA ribosyltransferase-isomerase [Granulicella aggregans]